MVEYCIIIQTSVSMVNFIYFGCLKSATENIYIHPCVGYADYDIIVDVGQQRKSGNAHFRL